jgi:hypothetical protein
MKVVSLVAIVAFGFMFSVSPIAFEIVKAVDLFKS